MSGILAICGLALGAAILGRATQTAPDLTAPEGVTTAYILAIQNREPDQAWDLLASPQAAGFFPTPRGETLTRERFRQQVLNQSRSDRGLRLMATDIRGTTARVEIEVTFRAPGPLAFLPGRSSGGTPPIRIFELTRQDNSWRITAAPSIFDLM